jgi:hypothetical protein
MQLLVPHMPRFDGCNAGILWYIVTMGQRKKATVMITVYHAIVEAIKLACPVEDIQEEIDAMDLLVAVIGKVLFCSNGKEAAMLVAEIRVMWRELWRLFRDDFMKSPTMHATIGFFEFFLSHQPRAHKAMGLKLESLHQYMKHGQ